ncbi:MAG: hypothetical protein OYL41_00420 [Acidobacteriota bacterium]|nr:hypothetical protein [Acidobacteriota bacterium]MDE3260419.1 hypothetical protein [Acidobacteriota bacterium]
MGLNEEHSGRSNYRESLIEKQFLHRLLDALWPEEEVEVLRPDVDLGGYDLVLEARGEVRHLQLKSALHKFKKKNRIVRGRLSSKPAGCVLGIVVDDDLRPKHYRWFGAAPGERLADVTNYPVATRPGTNKPRLDAYEVPAECFRRLERIEQVIAALFGPKPSP